MWWLSCNNYGVFNFHLGTNANRLVAAVVMAVQLLFAFFWQL